MSCRFELIFTNQILYVILIIPTDSKFKVTLIITALYDVNRSTMKRTITTLITLITVFAIAFGLFGCTPSEETQRDRLVKAAERFVNLIEKDNFKLRVDYNRGTYATYVAIDGNKIYSNPSYYLYEDNMVWLYCEGDDESYARLGIEYSEEDWKKVVKYESMIYNFAKLIAEEPDLLKYDAQSKTYKATDIEGEQAYKIYEAEYGFELSEDFKEGFKYKLAEVEIKLGKIRRVTLGNSVYELSYNPFLKVKLPDYEYEEIFSPNK